MINHEQVKETLQKILPPLGVKSYLLLYFDQDKIKFAGEITVSSLLPLFQDYLMAKFSGQQK